MKSIKKNVQKKEPVIDIVVIGDEILSGNVCDSNSHFISGALTRRGYPVRSVTIVRDRHEEMVAVLTLKSATADVLIVSGGLGPTSDDITRFAVAECVGQRLVTFPREVKEIHAKMKGHPRSTIKLCEIEALLPEKCVPLSNAVGMAPGIRVEKCSCTMFCIPGVPREAERMFEDYILPFLEKTFQKEQMLHAVIKTIGERESELYKKIRPFLTPQVQVGFYPKGKEVELRLHAHVSKGSQLARLSQKIHRLYKDMIYADEAILLEEALARLLVKKKLTVACAESCTGGLVTKRLTDVPGSSQYVRGSLIAYANDVKTLLLAVPESLLGTHGAVSRPVARAMACGVARLLRTDIGISITGIAGPGGGSAAKPVGLVFIGITYKGKTTVIKQVFRGDREKVRWLASQAALEVLWKCVREPF